MLLSLLWVSLSWPPFQLLNATDNCKGWRATPHTFLWIGIHLLLSLLVDAQRCLAYARAFWLVKALTMLPLPAQTTFFMKPCYCQDCYSSARLGWTLPWGLKFIGVKNTHAHSSKARNWSCLSLSRELLLQPAHKANSPFLQPPILLPNSMQRKCWKRGVTEGWSLLTNGQQRRYASDCFSLHDASLHCFTLCVGNNALSAPWKTKACGRSRRASWIFLFC